MRFRSLVVAGCATWVMVIVASDRHLSAEPSVSQWDGVFTAEQAARGEALYTKHCALCHGPDLEGEGHAPPLTGDGFSANWNDRPLSELFETIQTSMPPQEPGRLNAQETADVMAFMLRTGSYPSGRSELSGTVDALRQIRFLSTKP